MLESEQVIIGSKQLITQIIKGKRTKRQRPASPLLLSSSASSVAGGEGGDEEGERISYNITSPSTSIENAESIGEEEEMANCLILLAQGSRQNRKVTSEPRVSNVIAVKDGGGGLYVYQCKTCNRCFPSFQALGGHRTSHKRPKPARNEQEKKPVAGGNYMLMEEEEHDPLNHTSTTLSLQLTNRGLSGASTLKSNKVHECSICGAEFSSGQALGGHMRKHRTLTSTFPATAGSLSLESSSHDRSQEPKKPRNSLQLDLNLPAPEDDRRESEHHFATKEQVLVFSASPLVDCHY